MSGGEWSFYLECVSRVKHFPYTSIQLSTFVMLCGIFLPRKGFSQGEAGERNSWTQEESEKSEDGKECQCHSDEQTYQRRSSIKSFHMFSELFSSIEYRQGKDCRWCWRSSLSCGLARTWNTSGSGRPNFHKFPILPTTQELQATHSIDSFTSDGLVTVLTVSVLRLNGCLRKVPTVNVGKAELWPKTVLNIFKPRQTRSLLIQPVGVMILSEALLGPGPCLLKALPTKTSTEKLRAFDKLIFTF